MATSYPSAVDSLTNPTATSTTTSPSHAGQHTDVNDAIEAIEALLGTNATQTTPTAANRILQSTSASAITWASTPAFAGVNSVNATSSTFTIQNQTFTAGASHNAVSISPTWATENQNHTALNVSATQNGANTQTLTGINVSITKATVASTLATAKGINVAAPSHVGTVTNSYGIDIANQDTTASDVVYALRIQNQTAGDTRTRAIELEGSGISNGVRFGSSIDLFSSAAGRFTIQQPVVNADTPSFLTITGGAHTAITASQEVNDIDFNLDRTVQWATGALAIQRAVVISAPTYAFVGASTITATATLHLDQPPVGGTNATITNAIGFLQGVGSGTTTSIADLAVQQSIAMPGITNGTGTVTTRVGIAIGNNVDGSNVSLGNQTATLTDFIGVNVATVTMTSTTLTRTVTNAIGGFFNAPSSAGATVVETNVLALAVGGATTVRQAGASTIYSGIGVFPHTATLAATTQMTGTPGVAGVNIGVITVAQSGGAVTVDNGASLYIAGALTAGASVTITNNYAVWVDAGLTRLDGGVSFGSAATDSTLSNYTTWTTFTPTVTLVGGAGNTTPVYSTNTGRYLRIGSLVQVEIYLTGDGGAEGAGTGQVNIALPLTAGASHPTGYFIAGDGINGASGYILEGQIAGSATTIQLDYSSAIQTEVAFTGADQNNATRTIRLKFAYEV